MKNSQHVVPSSKGWKVRRGGSSKATKNFSNEEDAKRFAQAIAKHQKCELYIHKKNGMIQEIRSYGNYPFPPRDKK